MVMFFHYSPVIMVIQMVINCVIRVLLFLLESLVKRKIKSRDRVIFHAVMWSDRSLFVLPICFESQERPCCSLDDVMIL